MDKASRKIFNFESKVLEERTLEKFGYNYEDVGNSSPRKIVAICRFCGLEHDISKGNFIKAGSACHRACQRKEQGLTSPFVTDRSNTIAKAKKTNLERYGSDSDKNTYISKQSQKKTKECKELGLTERDWCLYRIWDCGKKRWIFEL